MLDSAVLFCTLVSICALGTLFLGEIYWCQKRVCIKHVIEDKTLLLIHFSWGNIILYITVFSTFSAGDYVKFGLPMAQSATLLAWGAIEFQDGYVAARQWDWMLDCLKWATDYFLKCHTGPNEFYAQVR